MVGSAGGALGVAVLFLYIGVLIDDGLEKCPKWGVWRAERLELFQAGLVMVSVTDEGSEIFHQEAGVAIVIIFLINCFRYQCWEHMGVEA